MHSCEYVKVTGYRKTKLLIVENIRFFNEKKQPLHSDHCLHLAECISITFKLQKQDAKNNIITQNFSGDRLLCPVHIWSSIICHLYSHPTTTQQTTVNTFLLAENKLHLFAGKELLHCLRMATRSISPDILGFTVEQIGLHSDQISRVPIFTNMLLGRWFGDTFLLYIRRIQYWDQLKNGPTGKILHNPPRIYIGQRSIESYSESPLFSKYGPQFQRYNLTSNECLYLKSYKYLFYYYAPFRTYFTSFITLQLHKSTCWL